MIIWLMMEEIIFKLFFVSIVFFTFILNFFYFLERF